MNVLTVKVMVPPKVNAPRGAEFAGGIFAAVITLISRRPIPAMPRPVA